MLIFFNDEYKSLEKKLTKYLSSIEEQIEQFAQNKTHYLELSRLSAKYNYNLDLQLSIERVDLSNNLSSLKKKFETKLKNKSNTLTLNKNLLQQIKEYDQATRELNKKLNKFKTYLRDKEYNEESIVKSAKEVVKKISLVQFNSNSKGKKPYLRARKAKKLKTNIRSLISNEQTKKQKAISKLKQEALYVNKFLKKLGVYNFEIDITDSTTENLKIIYSSTSQIKETLKHTLSSGEKTSFAYAYFLSKIKFEIFENENKSISDCVFVIDDPISSLDENRIYTTANLTWNFFKEAGQIFVLSHNLTFLKFFNNIVEAKNSEREDYLLRKTNGSSNIEEIPKKLRNYLSTYYLKMQDIKKFLDREIAYNEAKKNHP